jgi:hypothetical protein
LHRGRFKSRGTQVWSVDVWVPSASFGPAIPTFDLREKYNVSLSCKQSFLTKYIFLVSLCGLSSEEGWLMVFVIAPIEKSLDGENAELAVNISNELVPIHQLTGLFVGSKCATYAEKPKVFFFFDFEAGKKFDGLRVIFSCKSLISYMF